MNNLKLIKVCFFFFFFFFKKKRELWKIILHLNLYLNLDWSFYCSLYLSLYWEDNYGYYSHDLKNEEDMIVVVVDNGVDRCVDNYVDNCVDVGNYFDVGSYFGYCVDNFVDNVVDSIYDSLVVGYCVHYVNMVQIYDDCKSDLIGENYLNMDVIGFDHKSDYLCIFLNLEVQTLIFI